MGVTRKQKRKKTIVLGVTGSIAAYRSADLIRQLQDKGFVVKVVMTSEAEKFITPLTLASLSGEKVHRSMFDATDAGATMTHIDLAKEADVFLIAPATANIIGKIAGGMADDLVSCLALTTKAKILIAPAMNEDMYQNKIVQSNCAKLTKFGVKFINPTTGLLACGVYGQGHLADVEDIIKAVQRIFKK